MNEIRFVQLLQERQASVYEQALGLLWWIGRDEPTLGLTAREICAKLEASGLPAQNTSRLNVRLTADKATSKAGNGAWRLHPNARRALESRYAQLIPASNPPPQNTDSVIPTALVSARGYLEKVVRQLNLSYDLELFDCCTVMCRRTLETLLIEVYEHARRAAEIKGPDGHFLMLNGLIGYFERDSNFHLGRNALQGLRDFKALGDLSAHNRRFNARKPDIDRVRDGLRVAVEELAHLAGFRP